MSHSIQAAIIEHDKSTQTSSYVYGVRKLAWASISSRTHKVKTISLLESLPISNVWSRLSSIYVVIATSVVKEMHTASCLNKQRPFKIEGMASRSFCLYSRWKSPELCGVWQGLLSFRWASKVNNKKSYEFWNFRYLFRTHVARLLHLPIPLFIFQSRRKSCVCVYWQIRRSTFTPFIESFIDLSVRHFQQ